MSSPTVFTGSRTKFISSKGALLKDGSVIDNDGVPNFIKNGHAEIDTTGWATYADAAQSTPVDGTGGVANVTWTRSTTTPLAGAGSFIFTKDTSNRQGQGVSYTFSVDPAFRAKVCNIQFDYIFTSINGSFDTSNPNLTVYIYDITNSTLIQPSSYGFASNSQTIPDTFQASFQTSATGASYRLIFHVATVSTSGYTIKFDNIQVTPTQYAFGTPVTDWVSYTPTFTGLGTVSALTAKWRRIGDSMQVAFTVTSGTNTSSAASITIPSGFTIDSNKIGSNTEVGKLSAEKTPFSGGFVFSSGNTGLVYFTSDSANMTLGVAGTTWANTTVFGGMFTVPILGWSSSVQTSDQTSTRVVACRAERSTNQAGINPNNSAVKMNFNTISNTNCFDTVGGFNTTSYRYEVKVSGLYKISSGLSFQPTNVLNNRYILMGYKNGSEVVRLDDRIPAGTTDLFLGGSGIVNANSGDYFEIYIFGVGNNSVNTLTLGSGNNITYFAVERISGPNQIAASETVAMRAIASSTGQTFASGVFVEPIQIPSKIYDTHGMWNTSTHTATIPTSGKYQIVLRTSFQGTGTTSIPSAIDLLKNGSTFLSFEDTDANAAYKNGSLGDRKQSLYQATLDLKAGETIKFRAICYSTNSAGTPVTVSTSAIGHYVEIIKVGN